MSLVFTDPAVAGPLSLQQLNDDLTLIWQTLTAIQANAPNLAQFVPGFSATADGKGLNVTVNGATILTLALPRVSYNAGQYQPGTAYNAGAKIFGGTADGNTYYAPLAFTATTLAADKTNGNLVIDVQGVPLPLSTTLVKDLHFNTTVDVILQGMNNAIAALQINFNVLQAAQAKDKANIASINTALGNAKVAGFPLTLQ